MYPSMKRILAIEEDPDAANLLVLILKGFGSDVHSAVGGRAGLEAARTLRPDLVPVDLHLKDMPGLEVLRELGKLEGLESVRRAVLTAHGTPADVQAASREGIVDFLVKSDLISGQGFQRISRLLLDESPSRLPKSTARVLIVDDDESIRSLLKTALAADGLQCAEAADGAEAIQAAIAHPPDVILLDLHLPRLEGLDMMRMVHSIAKGASIPTIVMTGSPSLDSVRDSLAHGAMDYLVKSELSSEAGIERLRKAIAAAASRRRDREGAA
jgi:CheY-like chemotaxis protein